MNASTDQVVHTIRDAFLLVALVVFLFLGDWRSTLIPILAVPVSLIGTFFVLQAFGLSINLITLFALVLSIGIVVDNAIVVVEAVHAKMEEDAHLTPYKATQMALTELSGAIIAITLVMISVFVPIAFMSGPVGVFYRQFSITMASSILISGVVALSLTPVLCAMILKNNHGKRKTSWFDKFIHGFNRLFEKLTGRYIKVLDKIVTRRIVTFGVLALFVCGIVYSNKILPSGFVPNEDQGTIYAIIQTPPGSTLETTNKVAQTLQGIAEEVEGIESVTSLAGYEIMTEGRGSNAGTCLINLKPWSERKHTVHEIMEILEEESKDLGAIIEYFEPPALPGFGSSGGFSFRMLDKTGVETDYQEFDKINQDFLTALKKRKELKGLFTFFAANYPQYELEIDNEAAMQKGITIGKAMENLNILIGSTYEQGFIRFGRFFKVYTQAAPEYRRYVSDLSNFFVKNEEGEMVPYSSFMTIKKTQGPNEITRYNLFNSAPIRGLPAAGYTTGDAIDAIKQVAEETLPKGYDIAWEGLSYDESQRGNEAIYIFMVVLLFVYLILAAQYESFVLPFAVLLSLPIGIFGSFFMLKTMGLANDVYAQIGMIMLVGLLGKNAVLIVEFGIQRHNEGATVLNAAIEGAKTRFRPILMTSFAFIAGLIPLVVAHGAGAIGNKTIGSSALGGMLLGTIGGVLIIPGLYYAFGRMVEGKKLLYDESKTSLSEAFVESGIERASLLKKITKLNVLLKAAQRKNKSNEK